LPFDPTALLRDEELIRGQHTLLEAEQQSMVLGNNKIKELITVPRNRRAMQASEIVMFMQQV
jgi:hypothetical protein